MKKKNFKLSTTHIIMLSFLGVILTGTLLLTLPISSASGQWTSVVDALFTATTSTCVTGLVTVPTYTYWSTFGHVVILLLIQIGGLGIITITSCFAFFLKRKVGLSDRILLQDAFNLNSLSGLGTFVKKVVKGTLFIEAVGALLYMPVFVKDFGLKGIWIAFFNSVSAFCNAGLDIFASDSLCAYVHNPLINLTTCLLIVTGGIGFIVWWDVLRVIKTRKTKNTGLSALTLHSKIALSTTAVLILTGAVAVFAFEYNNPATMQSFTLFEKIQSSFFQSVTTRTAGFATLPQENLTTGSSIISIILMFIGGSPVGTAGGIKTVTITVLVASALASVRNEKYVSLFNRTLTEDAVRKALAVTVTSFTITIFSAVLLSAVTDAPFMDIIYETTSATATVGLSKNLTSQLNTMGKLITTVTMYLGRVGPVSLAVALNFKKASKNLIKNPTEDISVG